jgi:hypothetical protein
VRALAVPEADKATILGNAAREVLRVPVKN